MARFLPLTLSIWLVAAWRNKAFSIASCSIVLAWVADNWTPASDPLELSSSSSTSLSCPRSEASWDSSPSILGREGLCWRPVYEPPFLERPLIKCPPKFGGCGFVDSGSNWPTEYDWERYVLRVGWRGIANGIAESTLFSRPRGGLSIASSLKRPADPGLTRLVGEGKTSVSRCGGPFWVSEFHIVLALPHGKEALLEWPRTRVDPVDGAVLVLQAVVSAVGVAGCELVGENAPVPLSDGLRWGTCCTSVSHDERRAGFGPIGLLMECRRWYWSGSSSEDTSASESGVEPRTPDFDFSSRIAALPPGKPLKDVRFPWAVWTVTFTFDAMFLSCTDFAELVVAASWSDVEVLNRLQKSKEWDDDNNTPENLVNAPRSQAFGIGKALQTLPRQLSVWRAWDFSY